MGEAEVRRVSSQFQEEVEGGLQDSVRAGPQKPHGEESTRAFEGGSISLTQFHKAFRCRENDDFKDCLFYK